MTRIDVDKPTFDFFSDNQQSLFNAVAELSEMCDEYRNLTISDGKREMIVEVSPDCQNGWVVCPDCGISQMPFIEDDPSEPIDCGISQMPFIEDNPSEPIDFSDLIEKVYVDGRHTTIEWADGVKTTVGCMEGDHFDEYAGFCAAFVKRLFGGSREARDTFKKHRVVTTKKDRRAGDGRAQSCKHSKDRSNSSH